MSVSLGESSPASVRNMLLAIIFITGILSGILLESRVFRLFDDAANQYAPGQKSSAQASASTTTTRLAVAVPQVMGPVLVIEERTYDFGTLSDSETVEHTFVIQNSGNLPLEFSQVGVDCGWVSPHLSHKVVQPGASANLAIVGRLKGRKGAQKQTITLKSNDRTSETFLTIVGMVIPSESPQ